MKLCRLVWPASKPKARAKQEKKGRKHRLLLLCVVRACNHCQTKQSLEKGASEDRYELDE